MAAQDLCTLEEVRPYLATTGTGDDAILTRMITACSAAIAQYVSRTLLSSTFTKRLDGTGTKVLMVPDYPISSIASLAVDGLAVPANAYVFSNDTIVHQTGVFERGIANVEITYTAGYAAIPDDIKQACIELVCYRYKERSRIGEVSKSMGGQTVSFLQKDLPNFVKMILDPYRRVAII